MAGDLNVTILTGQILTDPISSRFNYQKTPVTTFSLQNNEHFVDSVTRKPAYHPNVIPIQTLGKNAEIIASRFRKGMRVYVSGYIRAEGESFTVRSHVVTPEETFYAQRYYEGMEHALDLLRTSRDKDAAIEALTVALQRGVLPNER